MRIFCIAKDSHIFSTKNNSVFAYLFSIYLTRWCLNDVVKLTMLWTTGPSSHYLIIFCTVCRIIQRNETCYMHWYSQNRTHAAIPNLIYVPIRKNKSISVSMHLVISMITASIFSKSPCAWRPPTFRKTNTCIKNGFGFIHSLLWYLWEWFQFTSPCQGGRTNNATCVYIVCIAPHSSRGESSVI